MPYTAADAAKTIAPWQVGSYLLENFATVDDVRQNMGNIVVPAVVFPAWGFVPPAHFVVYDAAGNSIVIEYIRRQASRVRQSAGGHHQYAVIRLAHDQPAQLCELLDEQCAAGEPWVGVTLQPLGQGTGMLGLPGDFTPPSRFVRAVAFSASVLPSKTGDDAVLELFHILNNFDIPKGSTRDGQKDDNGNIEADYTLWTSVCDLKTKRFYFRTYQNSQIRMIDLSKMNLDGKMVVTIPMKGNGGD